MRQPTKNIAKAFSVVGERIKNKIKSPVPLAIIAGGFVWIVFDSVALGLLTAAATVFLIKRDRDHETRARHEESES